MLFTLIFVGAPRGMERDQLKYRKTEGGGVRGLSAQDSKDLSSIYILPNTHSAPQSKHRAKTPK